MSLLVHSWMRRAVLGLMFLLAGAANCLCASYDADPNDEVPPVTVEFQYLVPQHAAGFVKNVSLHSGSLIQTRTSAGRTLAGWTSSLAAQDSSTISINPSHLSLSLRC